MPQKIEVSYKTIVFTVIFLLSLWLLFYIREIIFLVFVAFIIMSAFKPWTDFLEKKHLPRTLAVFFIYLLFIAVLAFIGSSILPVLIGETIHLSQNLPNYIKTQFPFITVDSQFITQQIAPLGENVFKVTVGLFGNLFSLFTLFVISFYLLIGRKNLEAHLVSLAGDEAARKLTMIIKRVEERLGAWVRGQLTLIAVIGVLTFTGLTILQFPYILPLAIIAGLLEIIPTIGPIISAIPAILVALTISPLIALITAVMYFFIQQFENHLVVPFVMRRVVGLPPIVTIIALLIGGKLAGIGGALLSIPVVVTIETVVSEYFKIKES